MPIANHFYHQTTPRYIALFGSLFNKMSITREDQSGAEVQRMIVPISYGPYQKFLAKITQDPELNRPQSISLPRMAFEISSMSYDGTRKTNSLNKMRIVRPDTSESFVYSPAPYNLEFNLYIMTKYNKDGSKILEQILPFFKPEYTFTAKIIDDLPAIDLPLILNSVSVEDIYDGDFETRRSLMWTLSFTMKAWFFGPTRDRKVIKFIDARLHSTMNPNAAESTRITIQPGLTVDGEPTSDINLTIPYEEIEIDDDWGIITLIQEYEDGA
jgi:hypothetical protein